MDNCRIDVTCEGRAALNLAIQLAFNQQGGVFARKATHYAIRPKVPRDDEKRRDPRPLRLIFFWASGPSDALPLPFTADVDFAIEFTLKWLEQADYGEPDDIDGSVEKGWRVYNEAWGHVDDQWQAIVAIAPEWSYYGK